MNVRRTPPPARLEHGIGSWLDGEQAVLAFFPRHQTAVAVEVGVGGRWVAIHFMDVAAGRVGLPDLHYGAGEGTAVFVGDAAFNPDALADGKRSFRCGSR